MRRLLPFVSLSVLLLVYVWHAYHPAPITQLAASAVPSSATKRGDAAVYPDPKVTPGDVLTTDAAAVCTSGYSTSVRNVPSTEKRKVYAEYNISYPQPQGSYEADHFIPLELGGSNDSKNLWPEPASPAPGFHEKDVVENYLHGQVCSGKMPLTEAQNEIRSDWYAVYQTVTR